MYIESVKDLMYALRTLRFVHEGKVYFRDYTSLGSYPVVFVFSDGERARPSSVAAHLWECARNLRDHKRDKWLDHIVGVDVFWEGSPDCDVLTGALIESAYGDPDSDDTESDD